MAKPTPDTTLFWPQSHFFSAATTTTTTAVSEPPAFSFPPEFPYEFGASSPPVESVAGSTENESSDDDDDFLASLTRRLNLSSSPYETQNHHHHHQQQLTAPYRAEDLTTFSAKTRVLTGSPQSTLSGIGSWSGRSSDASPNGHSRGPSPQTTPFADPWAVLYEAAGQVARLKMNRQAPPPPHLDFHQNLNQVHQQCASVWGRSQAKPNWAIQQQQLQMLCHENGKCNHPLPPPQTAWPAPQKHQNHRPQYGGSGSRVVVPGGSAVKRGGSGGTGVFLPRHYEIPSAAEPPRKRTGCATVLQLPPKMVHAMNLNIDDLNAISQTRFSNAFATDYDALLARRNAILMQQRLNLRREEIAAANNEVHLPQEWTY